MLTDTHCHLNFIEFDSDRDAVLERAIQVGIECILIPGLNIPTSLSAIKLAESRPMLFAAIGVHPTEALNVERSTLNELTKLAKNPKVKAIGEIGLDYYWDTAPHDLQRCMLKEQLNIAAQFGLPVVVHFRDKGRVSGGECASDLLKILEDWKNQLIRDQNPLEERPGVLHSFSGSLEMARIAVQLGFNLGVAGPVTYKKSLQLQDLVTEMPLDHLLLETDAPLQTPHPHRGKRNEPSYVRLIADKIAFVRSTTTEQVAKATSENARRIFAWDV